jgi:DnaJ-class molecular chaperone
MEEQATYECTRLRPPLPSLGVARPTVACPTCRGTGALGRKEEMVAHGDTLLVLTSTRWCPTCGGAGRIDCELNRRYFA